LQSKLSQLQKNILSINYGFKELISKQIVSQFQFFTEPDINVVQCLQEAFTFPQESRGMMK
jgi:hypothetical protein